jgi:hypothetical protein
LDSMIVKPSFLSVALYTIPIQFVLLSVDIDNESEQSIW